MIYFLIFTSLLIWPFGQLLSFSPSQLGVTLYLLDVSIALLTLALFCKQKIHQKIYSDPLFKPLLIFNLVATLSLFLNLQLAWSGGLIFSFFYLVRLWIYPSIYFALKLYPPSKILPIIILSLVFFCVLGLSQYLFLPDMRFLKLIGFDDHYYRLIGSFYDPNFTGLVFALVAIYFLSTTQWLASLPAIVLLGLTFSRASYLTFIFGVICLMWKKKNYVFVISIFLLPIIIYLIPKPFGEGVNLWRTFSIFSRFDSWLAGLQLFLQKPLIGWGYNTLRIINGNRFQIDNSYIFLAATTGIIGLLSFFNLLKSIYVWKLSLQKLILITMILFHSFFNNSYFYIWINLLFWVILALPFMEYKQE